ncbi:hypothetical protein EJ110_NYTH07729 [Nymphaea thermarum]|nr:hypothetical protein EJ110_NYTH07729 [Nymphaea thermarum]
MEGIHPEEEMDSIYHFSHLHVLKLIPADHGIPSTRCCDPTATTMMNRKKKTNPVYGCRPCNFYIHKNCGELLPYIRHPSHASHTLTLVHASPYLQGTSECDACCKPIDSSTGFSYHCTQCSFDLHTHCAFLPPTINNPSSGHLHLLSLQYPDVFSFATYKCDLCWKMIAAKAWLYYCLPCDFQAHTACVLARLGGSPLGSAAPRPMEGQPPAAGQPPNPLMTGFTPAVRPGQVSAPNWPIDGHPTAAAGQPPNGQTPAFWPGQVGAPGVYCGLDPSHNHASAPAQGSHTGNYGFEEWKRVDGSLHMDGQTMASGQPPNPLGGLTQTIWPGQVGASSGLDARVSQGQATHEENHGDSVASDHTGIKSQGDVPEKTSANGQDGESSSSPLRDSATACPPHTISTGPPSGNACCVSTGHQGLHKHGRGWNRGRR